MTFKQNNPGCACCGCVIYYEDFNGTGYPYDTTGSWSIVTVDGQVCARAAAAASLISQREDDTGDVVVSFYLVAGDLRADVDFYVRYLDADNALLCRFVHDPDTWDVFAQLFQRTSGVETPLTDVIEVAWSPSWEYPGGAPLTLCVIGNYFSANFADCNEDGTVINWRNTGYLAARFTDSSLGGKHGLLIDTVHGDYVDVNRIETRQTTEDCQPCDCGYCQNGSSPITITATISGVVALGTPTCSACSGYNTEVELTGPATYGSICGWGGQIPYPGGGSPCTAINIGVKFTVDEDGNVECRVILTYMGMFSLITEALGIETLSTPPIDCWDALDGLVIKLDDAGSGNTLCDWLNAEVELAVA